MVRKSCEEPRLGPPTLHLCPLTQELHLNSGPWLAGLAWHLPHCYRLVWQSGLLPDSATISRLALLFFEQWGTVYHVGEVTALPAALPPSMPGLPSLMEQGQLEMWDHQAVFILELRKYYKHFWLLISLNHLVYLGSMLVCLFYMLLRLGNKGQHILLLSNYGERDSPGLLHFCKQTGKYKNS